MNLFSLQRIKDVRHVFLIINTLVHLRVSQVFFLCLRRCIRRVPSKLKVPKRAKQKVFSINLVDRAPADVSTTRFCCFGEFLEYSDFSIQWDSAELSDLARFHLHYFDFLRRDQLAFSDQERLINDWIDKCDFSNRFAWDPFTASLRVVNWIAWCERHDYRNQRIDESIHSQLSFISKNDERELLANHYFENLKALLIGSLYFDTEESKRWKSKASYNLVKQLDEQFLADGGHYERTPFYHTIMTENLLDLVNALRNRSSESPDLFCRLAARAEDALAFLADIRFPDGSIPLFNDSVLNASSSLDQIFDYAVRLGFRGEHPLNEVVERSDVGIFAVRAGGDMLAFNTCPVGPSYQPGHTHNDMLSFEVMLRGRRLFTNSGVFGYADSPDRAWCRSTAAHNTVQVADLEQSEVWSSFRVGRRALIENAVVELASQSKVVLFGGMAGGFAGSLSRKKLYKHSRKIVISKTQQEFRTVDSIDSVCVLKPTSEACPIHFRYLIGPDFSVVRAGDATFDLLLDDNVRVRATFSSNVSEISCSVEPATFSLGFGERAVVSRLRCTVMARESVWVTTRLTILPEPIPGEISNFAE